MIRRTAGARLLLAISLAVVATMLNLGRAQAAAPAFSITTSPVSIGLNIVPGTTTTTTLQIMNNNPLPVQVSLELDSFGANGTTGEASVAPIAASDPSRSWVHFSQSTFDAQPGVWTPIKMTIALPKSASLGYYYAVLFKPTIPIAKTPHTSTIKGSNAVLILVDTKSANEQRQLQVSKFTVSKKLYEYLPASFSVTVHNNGNIYLPPTGDIFISRSSTFTPVIDHLPINVGGGNVLPESVRTFKTSWIDGFPVFKPVMAGGQAVTKNGKPVEKLDWDFTQLGKFRFGKYYAHLALVYSNGNQDIPIDSVVSFWVVPWKLLLGALAVLAVIGLGLFAIGRTVYRRLRAVRKKRAKK